MRTFLAATGFKDVVCEVVGESHVDLVLQWWNVSPSFPEPFPMMKNSKTLAMETIAKSRIKHGEWASFDSLDDAVAYVRRQGRSEV